MPFWEPVLLPHMHPLFVLFVFILCTSTHWWEVIHEDVCHRWIDNQRRWEAGFNESATQWSRRPGLVTTCTANVSDWVYVTPRFNVSFRRVQMSQTYIGNTDYTADLRDVSLSTPWQKLVDLWLSPAQQLRARLHIKTVSHIGLELGPSRPYIFEVSWTMGDHSAPRDTSAHSPTQVTLAKLYLPMESVGSPGDPWIGFTLLATMACPERSTGNSERGTGNAEPEPIPVHDPAIRFPGCALRGTVHMWSMEELATASDGVDGPRLSVVQSMVLGPQSADLVLLARVGSPLPSLVLSRDSEWEGETRPPSRFHCPWHLDLLKAPFSLIHRCRLTAASPATGGITSHGVPCHPEPSLPAAFRCGEQHIRPDGANYTFPDGTAAHLWSKIEEFFAV